MVSSVCAAILQGYLERCPQLAGRTFGEAAFYFPDATPIALVQANRCCLMAAVTDGRCQEKYCHLQALPLMPTRCHVVCLRSYA